MRPTTAARFQRRHGSSRFFSRCSGGRVAVLLQRLLLVLLPPVAFTQSCGTYTASSGQTMPWSAALYEPTRGSFIDRRIMVARSSAYPASAAWDSPDVYPRRPSDSLPTLYAACSSALHTLTRPEYDPRAWAGRKVLFHLQHRVVQWGQLLLL